MKNMNSNTAAKIKLKVDPLGRLGMNRQIAEQLMKKICSGEIPFHARLPGEQVLANQLNVSRDVIR